MDRQTSLNAPVSDRDEPYHGLDDLYGKQSPSLATSTSSRSFFNLTIAAVGGGVLAFPYAYSETGLASGVIVTLIILPIVLFSEYIITLSTEQTKSTNYVETVARVLNPKIGRFCDFVVWLSLMGAGMAYVALIGDLGQSVIGGNSSKLIMLIAGFIILFPCFNKKTGHVGWISGLGLLPIVLLLGVIWVSCFQKISEGNLPSIESFKWDSSYLNAFPFFTFAYQCHPQIPPIYDELQDKSVRKMSIIILAAMIVESFIYISIGILGYIAFGLDTKANIIDNYASDDIPMTIVRATMIIHFLSAIPINFLPIRIHFYQFVNISKLEQEKTWVHVLTTFGLLFVIVLLAIVAPGASVFFSLVGSTCGVVIIFVFPGLFAYYYDGDDYLPGRWVFVLCCVICTFVIGIGGTTMTVKSIFFD